MYFSSVKVGTIGHEKFFSFVKAGTIEHEKFSFFLVFMWSTVDVAVEKGFYVVYLLVVVE